jgi:radical SAM enzyme (TIGR01210 family)
VPSSPSTSEPAGRWDGARVLALRPPKVPADPSRPYAFLVEPERTRAGAVEDTAIVFLTNRECPFRCLMCDLWRHTTDRRVPDGAIAAQVEYALARLPPARHVKLYNAGNFFDAQAIPPADWPRLAELLTPFQTVIIENHPRLVGPRCLAFRDLLRAELQAAMGLETVHPEVLPRLNKRMTLADFEAATRFLTGHGVPVRAFILLRPPFLGEAEGVHWAKESIRFAFDVGVECCVVIPTRAGNGAMDELQRQGHFSPPRLESLEEVLDFGVGLRRGRVFADLWDLERFYPCGRCGPERARRLHAMNLSQEVAPPVVCACAGRPPVP